MVIEQLTFHRRDDPAHEYRELVLSMTKGLVTIVEVVGFLDGEGADWNPGGVKQRKQLHMGSESQRRNQLAKQAKRLCEEGFTPCHIAPEEQSTIDPPHDLA
jgi:hypothetical protein